MINLSHKATGSGPPAIILHGLFGSSRNWQTLAGKLGRTHRVISVDLRNHGKSEQADTMSYAEMAGDILEFIKTQKLENVSLIGHSMGGKTAMTSALMQPGSIARLVVLDIAPVAYKHRYGKLFHALANLSLSRIRSRKEAEQKLDALINDITLSRFLLQNLTRSRSGYRWRINLETIKNNIERISNFPVPAPHSVYHRPALFLGGAESHLLQPSHLPTIRAYFPAATIEVINGAGHMLHIDQPEIVLDRIAKFIGE